MRLIDCRIENFGKLSRCAFDFTDDTTVIFAENGWGKTTLAAFIKCMFYGMPDSRAKSAESNVRLRYKPWQGGVYGGSLTFEARGKRYLVKRTFGDSVKGDDCRVYDVNTNLPSADFPVAKEGLGEALFGVDEKGYDRLVYLPQGSVEIRLDGGLQAALLRSGESLSGSEDVDGAVERIETEERLLRAKRKPAKGRLDILDEQIFALEEEIFEAETKAKKWQEISEKVALTDQKIASAKGKSAKTAQNSQPTQPKKGALSILLTGLGAILVLFGIVAMFLPDLPKAVAIAACAVGFVLVVVALIVLFRQKSSSNEDERVEPRVGDEEIESLIEEKQKILWEGQPYLLATEKLPQLKAALAQKQRERAALEKRAWQLATAKGLLLEAKRQTTGDYLTPLTARCRELFAKFYPEKAVVLTADGEVRLDEAGEYREGAYYSAGMRAALGICIRLALVERLFEKETPALILDDPFVDMDEENLAIAKAFLGRLQKEYQLIYLTCHKSRLL